MNRSHPLYIKDELFYVGQRCLGNILEIKVTAAGCVDGLAAEYTAELEDKHEVAIQVQTNSELDKFLGITMHRKIWVWCFEGRLKGEISNYDRLERYRRPSG